MEENNRRLEWADISKGLVMILVILGHCVKYGGTVHNLIFSFHMPFFFVLSGLFVRDEPIKKRVIKKTRSLLVPYCVFFAVGLIITFLIPAYREAFSFNGLGKDLYFANPTNINVSSIWFLVCLFFTDVIFNVILKIKNTKTQKVLCAVIMILGLLYGLLNSKGYTAIIPGGRLPLELDVVPVALGFLSIGYFFKEYVFKIVERIKAQSIINQVVIAVLLCAIYFVGVKLNGTVNLRSVLYHNWILYIFNALVGTLIVINVSVLLERIFAARNVMTYIGENTIVILGIQAVLYRLYVVIANSLLGTDYEPFALPIQHVIGCFAFTLFLSVAVCALYNKLKRTKAHGGKN